MRAVIAPTRPLLARLSASGLLLLASAGIAAAQSPPRETAPPIWTNVPTRIDRSQETRERIEPPPPPPRRVVLAEPARVIDSATLIVDGRTRRLRGLLAVPRDRLCVDRDGRRWTCGMHARGALVQAIEGRAVLCRPAPADALDPPLDCDVADRSLSERLLAEGWADLDDEGRGDPALAAARASAERDGRGVWARSTQ